MSDIILNGNTYRGVGSVRLMKADNSGYATYVEGAAPADSMVEKLCDGTRLSIGDIFSEETNPFVGWLSWCNFGTADFSAAVNVHGPIANAVFDNLLLPNLTAVTSSKAAYGNYPGAFSINNVTCSGMIDLSKLTSIQNGNARSFQTIEAQTLKIGAFDPQATGMFYNSKLTNLVWNVPANQVPGANNVFITALNTATYITNLYVPADLVDTVRGYVTGGSVTKVTNVYSIADWSDLA